MKEEYQVLVENLTAAQKAIEEAAKAYIKEVGKVDFEHDGEQENPTLFAEEGEVEILSVQYSKEENDFTCDGHTLDYEHEYDDYPLGWFGSANMTEFYVRVLEETDKKKD